jgi:glycosyl hydrolase family 16
MARSKAFAIAAAVAGAVIGIIAPFAPAYASTTPSAPFTWEGVKWCPNYYGSTYGGICGAPTLAGTGSSAAFYPSQVNYSGSSSPIYLQMNSRATESGAFNSETQETWSAPATLSEQISLPCNRSGQVENWPAFWLVTTGAWPAGGEIDVMEGLNGTIQWHYHYLSVSGVNSAVGGALAGFSGCGTHTYEVNWTTSAITFYYDGRNAGSVTPAEIGVPIAAGPMFLVNDYAASSAYGGPTVGNTKMEVLQLANSGLTAGPDQQSPTQQSPDQPSPDQQTPSPDQQTPSPSQSSPSPSQSSPSQQGLTGMWNWMTGAG